MTNFIHKIFEGKIDNFVHLQFQKFSRGEFKNKALIEASSSKKGFRISTTAEFANGLVKVVAEKIKDKVNVKGVVVSTSDLEGQIDYQNKKQFMGIKQYVLDKEMSKEDILNLCEKVPTAFMALSFDAGDTSLKIKPKAPKSAKPSTKGKGAIKVNFCKIITTDKELVKDILFDLDIDNFKKASINHTFLINEIILPKESNLTPEQMRTSSKRKGTIIREIEVNEKKSKSEKEFEA